MAKCEKCGAFEKHSPLCEDIDFETAKYLLAQYFKLYQENYIVKVQKIRARENELYRKSKKEAEFWKGKFSVVKTENNALRKKISKK